MQPQTPHRPMDRWKALLETRRSHMRGPAGSCVRACKDHSAEIEQCATGATAACGDPAQGRRPPNAGHRVAQRLPRPALSSRGAMTRKIEASRAERPALRSRRGSASGPPPAAVAAAASDIRNTHRPLAIFGRELWEGGKPKAQKPHHLVQHDARGLCCCGWFGCCKTGGRLLSLVGPFRECPLVVTAVNYCSHCSELLQSLQ